MEYNFREIEKKWQQTWKVNNAYKVSNNSPKPKYYVLDMFPYPSGAGLHVGHPLGYIASDIYARYKRLKGFNVLHPMGYDSFGLPAEQYALETGQHPADTTENNINTFRQQLDNIGFSFDWSREIRTSDPKYYKWTQWIFLQLFNSYFCNTEKKALPISKLIRKYQTKGAMPKSGEPIAGKHFTAEQWNNFSEKEKNDILMNRRLAYLAYGEVNWCEALGTVLANDEVINGVSERGGHPVIKKQMRQWYLRITAYAERLLDGLGIVDFSDAMKEMQRNWIGKSEGAEIQFKIKNQELKINVYTTRPETIFGVDFMVLAPEHDLVSQITTPEQKIEVEKYLEYTKGRSERERLTEVRSVTGAFTGSYAVNPFDGREIPIWISEYVLAGYGTGAIMAVPSGDQRDFNFAMHFNIPITNIIGENFSKVEANATKDATLSNSGFLSGMRVKDAIDFVVNKMEEMEIGKRKVNYKMRDAGFSRQRYWGEPFPIVYKNGIAYPIDENQLPVTLPYVENYKPGPEGEGPLANIPEWVNLKDGSKRETNTMPGYAGSSWYFLRYMDPFNDKEFAHKKITDYWNQVDVYVGGTEHAVGHLLYSRMWTKVLFDLGLISFDEPFRKLVNQGMITGFSFFINVVTALTSPLETNESARSADSKRSGKLLYSSSSDNGLDTSIFAQIQHHDKMYYDPKIVMQYRLKNVQDYIEYNNLGGYRLSKSNLENYLKKVGEDFAGFKFQDVIFDHHIKQTTGEDVLVVDMQIEKMSKSKFNVVNPNDLIEKYGADTFRMYEMFLGPVEASKPWDTKGIEGVHRFLRKLWRLFFDEQKGKLWNEQEANDGELKVLHKTIRKIEEDTERFSYNTAVSAFMVCVNELTDLRCHKKEILEQLIILLTPYAPHIAEELWHDLGNNTSILDATFPAFNPKYLLESSKQYPVSVNGKLRTMINISLDATRDEVEKIVMENDVIKKWLDEKQPKKIIYVKNKMVNVVI